MFAPSMLVGASGELVTLVGATLANLRTAPADAQVRYRLLSTGEEQTASGVGAAFSTIGIWLLFGSAGDYQARYVTSGDETTPDTKNTLVELSGDAEFGYLQSGIGSQTAAGTIEIIWKPTGLVIASATLNLTASVDPA